MITVAIVEDDPLIRAGIAALVGAQPDLSVAGQAADGDEAVDDAPRRRAVEDMREGASAKADEREPCQARGHRAARRKPPMVAEAVGDGAEHDESVEVDVRVEERDSERGERC